MHIILKVFRRAAATIQPPGHWEIWELRASGNRARAELLSSTPATTPPDDETLVVSEHWDPTEALLKARRRIVDRLNKHPDATLKAIATFQQYTLLAY